MKLLTTATAALLVLSTAAFAQDVQERPSHVSEGNMFERLDADGSGTVTLEEFENAKQKLQQHGRGDKMNPGRMIRNLDQDGDNAVSSQEWGKIRDKMKEMKDGRGEKPSPEEMANRAFDRLDTNEDGMLSREEFVAGAGKMHERRDGMQKPFGKPGEKPFGKPFGKPGEKPMYKQEQGKE